MADLSVDNDEDVRASIRQVQQLFADAKHDAETRFEKIVDTFCDGQRKYFQLLLKSRRTSDQGQQKGVEPIKQLSLKSRRHIGIDCHLALGYKAMTKLRSTRCHSFGCEWNVSN